jgi:hypothetical protein
MVEEVVGRTEEVPIVATPCLLIGLVALRWKRRDDDDDGDDDFWCVGIEEGYPEASSADDGPDEAMLLV